MASIKKLLFRRWLVTLAGCLLLDLVVWFVGPVLGLDSLICLGIMAGVLVVWAGLTWWAAARKKRTERAMVDSLAGPGAGASDEVAQLRKRFEGAEKWLKTQATRTGEARHLHEQPLYILIGPPGAGKTTALTRSGVKFVAAEGRGTSSVRGVGGTRNCDWWFGEDAILLDTAGRFTTQDSDRAADQTAWLGFVDLLKSFRPRQPINGAIIAISLSDLAALSEPERVAQAATVRERLMELHERLGILFPVYLVFTKLDKVAGFSEMFETLPKEERQQVWGLTFPFHKLVGDDQAVASTGDRLEKLQERLGAHVLDRLQEEADPKRRFQIYAFPAEFAALLPIADDFIHGVFWPSRLETIVPLRGVYFSSGVQEGNPIDRILGALARSYGVAGGRPPSLVSSGRSYFLGNLLEQVIFREAGLVTADQNVERRLRLVRRVAYVCLAVVTIGSCAAWGYATLSNRALVDNFEAGLNDYKNLVKPFADQPVTSADPRPILPALDKLRSLATPPQADFLTKYTGLYQGQILANSGESLYLRALNSWLLPRLLLETGARVKQNLAQPENLRPALKAYLMLGGDHFSQDYLQAWLESPDGPIATDYPQFANQLKPHIDKLLSAPLSNAQPNPELVKRAREALAGVNQAAEIYATIKSSEAAANLPRWQITDHIGVNGSTVLALKGKPLTEGVIPGLYTYDGFQNVLLPEARRGVEVLEAERWVTGERAAPIVGSDDSAKLEQGVDDLYEDDYINRWDALLASLSNVHAPDPDTAATHLRIWGSKNDSPLKDLLSSVVKESQLTRAPNPVEAGALGAASKALAQKEPAALKAIVPRSTQGPKPGAMVEDHFKRLAEFVGNGAGPAPIDDLLPAFEAAASAAAASPDAAGGGGAAKALQSKAAAGAPPQVASLVAAVANNAAAVADAELAKPIRDDWNSNVVPDCQRLLRGYPFVRGSATDVTIDDFKQVFGKGGLIDAFVTSNKAHIDMSKSPWVWQKTDGDLGLGTRALAEMKQAHQIADSFLPSTSEGSIAFRVKPIDADSGSASVVLTVDDDKTIVFKHDAATATLVKWPAPNGGEARLEFTPLDGDAPAPISASGPWAWFRLIEHGSVTPRPDGHFTLTMKSSDGKHSVSYDLAPNSAKTEVTLGDLESFQCSPM